MRWLQKTHLFHADEYICLACGEIVHNENERPHLRSDGTCADQLDVLRLARAVRR